jgi:RimJ/RimL family protein N-acetyltransferase
MNLVDLVSVAPSERLYFRLLEANQDDGNLLFELDQDVEVMHFINGGKPTSRDEIAEVFLPRLNAYRDAEKGWGLWAVFQSEDDQYLGWVLVRPMHFFSDSPDFDDIELGWRFKKSSWGKGIATEASKQIMYALHEQCHYKLFSAIAVTENYASIAIMKKLGMTFQSSGIHKDPLGDMLVDTYQVKL